MKKVEKLQLIESVKKEGKKAYSTLELTQKEAYGLLELLDKENLLNSKDRKIQNFRKYLDSLLSVKIEEKKADDTKLEQTILEIVEPKEEPKNEQKEELKEESKPVEKEEPKSEKKDEKKVSNKKPVSKEEKQRILIERYKEGFYEVLGDQKERKNINTFLRTECTNEEMFDYFNLADFKINPLGLGMLKDRAIFILECEGEFERMTIVDKDVKDGRVYYLVKSLDSKNYDRIYLDNYDSKTKTFKHTVGEYNYNFKFHIPVLKEGANIN